MGDGETLFDNVFAMYGRLREIARVFGSGPNGKHRCGRFISIGGNIWAANPAEGPILVPHSGTAVPINEEDAFHVTSDGTFWGKPAHPTRRTSMIMETEQVVFREIPSATHLKYPLIYGPHQLINRDILTLPGGAGDSSGGGGGGGDGDEAFGGLAATVNTRCCACHEVAFQVVCLL